jgi:isopenicillin N synthase-like dioxygenase
VVADLRWPERDIVEAIHSASAGPGFFYLLGHGIPEAVFKETIQASHSFFEQPTQLKQQISALNYGGQSARGDVMTKGYTRPGSEGAYKKDTATDVRPEKEAATLQTNGRETLVYRFPEVDDAIRDKSYWRNDSEVGRAARKFFMKNQWPGTERLPQFRSAVQEFFDHSARVAGRVIKYIDAAAHPLDANGHAIKHDLGMHTFNFAHYHPNSQYAFGISDHTDWEYFTLLYPSYLTNNSNIDQETGISFTGLEVFFHEEWISVPHVPGSLIVNLGEVIVPAL